MLDTLEAEAILILCKSEMCFLPSFFVTIVAVISSLLKYLSNLSSFDSIYSFMRFELENKKHEEFFVLYLDKRFRFVKKELILIK